jgi:hypothetical protein
VERGLGEWSEEFAVEARYVEKLALRRERDVFALSAREIDSGIAEQRADRRGPHIL